MAVDFKSLLHKPADSIEKPKPLPPGTYFGTIKKYEFAESKEKKTPYIRFHLGVSSPGEDVDQSLLQGVDMAKKQLRKDFFITDDALYRLKEFLEAIGIGTAGRSLDECVPEAVNASVMVAVTQKPTQDGKDLYNEVGDISAPQG